MRLTATSAAFAAISSSGLVLVTGAGIQYWFVLFALCSGTPFWVQEEEGVLELKFSSALALLRAIQNTLLVAQVGQRQVLRPQRTTDPHSTASRSHSDARERFELSAPTPRPL
jgi:hypothetical protein